MAYTALPDRRLPYHRDGTVVGWQLTNTTSPSTAVAQGFTNYLSSGDRSEFNDQDYTALSASLAPGWGGAAGPTLCVWWFFPEQREVTAFAFGGTTLDDAGTTYHVQTSAGTLTTVRLHWIQGSSDTTNGVDGTWETASLPSGATVGFRGQSLDLWRGSIGVISFTGGNRAIRAVFVVASAGAIGQGTRPIVLGHIYGEKVAGQTPNDLIFIDHDTTPGAEFTAPEDFGDRPLGTTVTRQFRVKNASATLTANTINLQCNDSDFTISEDGTTWVTTINIASLAAGAESATLYVRNTTPAAGNPLGPRFAEIVALVGSWT